MYSARAPAGMYEARAPGYPTAHTPFHQPVPAASTLQPPQTMGGQLQQAPYPLLAGGLRPSGPYTYPAGTGHLPGTYQTTAMTQMPAAAQYTCSISASTVHQLGNYTAANTGQPPPRSYTVSSGAPHNQGMFVAPTQAGHIPPAQVYQARATGYPALELTYSVPRPRGPMPPSNQQHTSGNKNHYLFIKLFFILSFHCRSDQAIDTGLARSV